LGAIHPRNKERPHAGSLSVFAEICGNPSHYSSRSPARAFTLQSEMPWTQTDIDTLKQAIVDRKGAKSIQFSDQLVTFESIDEMLKLLAVMTQAVSQAAGTSRTRYGATSKGL
jgi:hypothetical protein